MFAINKYPHFIWLTLSFITLASCSSQPASVQQIAQQSNGSEWLVVDCLLPGQIRNLGSGLTYLTQRKPIKTSAVDCEIRGGEYVAFDRADYKTALSIWLPQAQEGNPEAQVYVGEIYEKGHGLAPDYVVAAHWYKKAAMQGNSRAQINLGYLYEKGLGVDSDLVSALNWYRKASGLESDDIAFASTIEIAVKAEYEDELNLLRNALDSRQAEIDKLQSELKNSRKNYHREQKKLNKLKSNLNKSRNQVEQLKSVQITPDNSTQLSLYQQKSQDDAAKVKQQLELVEQMKADLNKNNNQLKTKLKQSEQRSIQLSEDLIKHKQEEGLLKAQLITAENQLSSSRLSIAQLKDRLLSEQNKIDDEKKALNTLKKQLNSQHTAELSEATSQLTLRNKELAKHHILITQLETEKSRITLEKNSLTADQNKSLTEKNQQLEGLNSKLTQKNQNLEKQRTRITQLEAEKERALLTQKELQKASTQNMGASKERIKQLESQLAQHEQSYQQQTTQIQSLQKDKQSYEFKIKHLEAKKQQEQQQKLAFAKPSIEILDPPFTITRATNALSVRLRSAMSHREITGRVIASAGLMSFNINGINEKVNPSGLFKTKIKLLNKDTLVKAIAIDKVGNKASLEFTLLPLMQQTPSIISLPPENVRLTTNINTGVNFGTYHALIIGNQQYQYFSDLQTPVNDAKTVASILKDKYGFKTTLLLNANRHEILSALNKLRSELTEADNLLIYYAGHGELDRVNLRGHWLPVDAEADNTANWISTIAITDIVNIMSAKQVLIVADSCYSGAMTRSSLARLETGMTDTLRYKWLRLMSQTRSRTVLTSGGLKPVLDVGMNGHSIFANAFIDAISNNDKILEGQKLYRIVHKNLVKITRKLNFKQEPQYAPIRHGGHEAGDFFLVSNR